LQVQPILEQAVILVILTRSPIPYKVSNASFAGNCPASTYIPFFVGPGNQVRNRHGLDRFELICHFEGVAKRIFFSAAKRGRARMNSKMPLSAD
jgi:hypothetical protein